MDARYVYYYISGVDFDELFGSVMAKHNDVPESIDSDKSCKN